MAIRLFGVVLRGEINNCTKNSVFGFFVLSPQVAETRDSVSLGCEILHFSLAGNLRGDLAGRSFRFEVPSNNHDSQSRRSEKRPCATKLSTGFSWSQFGVLGDAEIRTVREVPPGVSMDQLLSGEVRAASLPTAPSLYFEWFGPNGRIVIEEIRPHLIFTDLTSVSASGTETLSAPPLYLGSEQEQISERISKVPVVTEHNESSLTGPMQTDHGEQEMTFENELHNAFAPEDSFRRDFAHHQRSAERPAAHRRNRWRIASLVEVPNISVQNVMNLSDHAAWKLLIQVLQQLAPFGMALDVCPHCSPQTALRLLLFTILPSTQLPTSPAAEGLVLHLSTWDHCQECLSASKARTKPKRPRSVSGRR